MKGLVHGNIFLSAQTVLQALGYSTVEVKKTKQKKLSASKAFNKNMVEKNIATGVVICHFCSP